MKTTGLFLLLEPYTELQKAIYKKLPLENNAFSLF